MQHGIVKWFSAALGYGFILDGAQMEHFVHFSNIKDEAVFKTLSNGEPVTFEPFITLRGPAATSVRRVQQ